LRATSAARTVCQPPKMTTRLPGSRCTCLGDERHRRTAARAHMML
jgi:hypothetical protein